MRLHQVLGELLGVPARVKVLRALIRPRGAQWTGREMARAAGCSAPQAMKALLQFERLGLVSRRTVGRAHLWKFDEEHVLGEPIRSLFTFESELPNRFQRDLEKELRGLPIRSARLFGSVARGTETNDSDVDLYLELGASGSEEELQRALTGVMLRFIRKYGTVISPFIHSKRDVKKPSNPALLSEIREQGISLIGQPA